MEMDSQAHEQVKELQIDIYKRMGDKKRRVCSLQTESWCMNRRQSGDYRMAEGSDFYQEYTEHRQ